jgi:signal transduction histidine kinase
MNGLGGLMVKATLEEGKFVLRIRDTDPAIPDAMQPRILEPLVTTQGRDEGTGHGLPLCRKLIEGHHGQIDLEPSESVPVSACNFRFPVAKKSLTSRASIL